MGFGGKFLEEKLYKCSLHENCTVHYFFSDNIWDKLIGQKKMSKRLGHSLVTSKLEGIP